MRNVECVPTECHSLARRRVAPVPVLPARLLQTPEGDVHARLPALLLTAPVCRHHGCKDRLCVALLPQEEQTAMVRV